MPVSYQVAAALDEGLVEVYVPKAYPRRLGTLHRRRRAAVPQRLARASSIAKAKELTEEAVKPDAPLLEISYALEGIGEPALQYTLPLMAHPNPDVAFAMARAAAFIGDASGAAQDALLRIAARRRTPVPARRHPDARRRCRPAPSATRSCATCWSRRTRLARTAAYKVLVRNGDASIYTRWVSDPRDSRPRASATRSSRSTSCPPAASRSSTPRAAASRASR